MEDKINVTHTGALTLVLMVVAVGIGFSFAAQPVNAQAGEIDTSDWSDDGIFENLAEGGCTIAGPATIFVSKCTVEYGDVDGSTPEQVQYDAYSDGVFMKDTRDQRFVERLSYLNQTEGIAAAKAKQTLIQCMNNETVKSTCVDRAREDINNFYAATQKSVFVSQNRQIQKWRTVHNKINDTENVNLTEFYNPISSQDNFEQANFENRTVTLYNGKQMNVTAACYVERTTIGNLNSAYKYQPQYYTGDINVTCSEASQDTGRKNITFTSPGNYTIESVEGHDYKQVLDTVDQNRQRSFDNLQVLADSIYSKYDPNEISYTDTAGPLELLIVQGSKSNSTGYYGYSVLQAANLGLAVPDNVSSMTVRSNFDSNASDQETRTGMVVAPRGTFPNDTIETNRTYSPNSLQYDVTLAITNDDGPSKDVLLTDNFTITSMRNPKTGESINQTKIESSEYQTTNTTKLNAQIDDLQQKLDTIENQTGTTNITVESGGLFGGTGLPSWATSNYFIGGLAIAGTTMLGIGLMVALAIVGLAIKVYLP